MRNASLYATAFNGAPSMDLGIQSDTFSEIIAELKPLNEILAQAEIKSFEQNEHLINLLCLRKLFDGLEIDATHIF